MSSSRLLCGVLLVSACSLGSVEPGDTVDSRFDDAIATARSLPDGAIEADLIAPDGEALAALDVSASGRSALWLPEVADGESVDVPDRSPAGVNVALYAHWKNRAANTAYSEYNVCVINTPIGAFIDKWAKVASETPLQICLDAAADHAHAYCKTDGHSDFFSTSYIFFESGTYVGSGYTDWQCVDGASYPR
jgi:hypothetical protein